MNTFILDWDDITYSKVKIWVETEKLTWFDWSISCVL